MLTTCFCCLLHREISRKPTGYGFTRFQVERIQHSVPRVFLFFENRLYPSFLMQLSCVCVCVCMCMCVCVCSSNISADQDQADLRVSTWLLFGSRVCNVRFVWTTMISLINYFTNALQILQALSTRATTVTCAPEPITAELTSTTYLKKKSRFIPAAARAGPRFCRRFGPVLFCASKLTVVD